MTDYQDPTSENPHKRSYVSALMLVILAGLGVGVLFVLLFETGTGPDQAMMFRFAAVWIAVYFAIRWLVTRRYGMAQLTEAWKDRLTQVIPSALVLAIFMRTPGGTHWSNVTELVGTWAIACVILLLGDLALQWLHGKYRAFRNRRS
jgi:ABC-type transport system involved in cytochrome c biogenesis permease component